MENNLFETLANDLRPENSPAQKDELTKKAEEEVSRIEDPSSSHFQNYVLAYMIGHRDGQIQSTEEGLVMSKNLLDSIK